MLVAWARIAAMRRGRGRGGGAGIRLAQRSAARATRLRCGVGLACRARCAPGRSRDPFAPPLPRAGPGGAAGSPSRAGGGLPPGANPGAARILRRARTSQTVPAPGPAPGARAARQDGESGPRPPSSTVRVPARAVRSRPLSHQDASEPALARARTGHKCLPRTSWYRTRVYKTVSDCVVCTHTTSTCRRKMWHHGPRSAHVRILRCQGRTFEGSAQWAPCLRGGLRRGQPSS